METLCVMIEHGLPEITVSNKNKTEFSITNYLEMCMLYAHHDESTKSKCSTESLIMLGVYLCRVRQMILLLLYNNLFVYK